MISLWRNHNGNRPWRRVARAWLNVHLPASNQMCVNKHDPRKTKTKQTEMSLCSVMTQIRSSITTLLFSGREFSWTRHMLIAAAILAFNNMLVIFVPTIRDIFGFIGEFRGPCSTQWVLLFRKFKVCCVWACLNKPQMGNVKNPPHGQGPQQCALISSYRSEVTLLYESP